MSPAPFSPHVVAQLRVADRKLRSADRGDRQRLYAICRGTMAGIAPVDSFVIGIYQGDSVFYPYTYDHGVYLEPTTLPVTPHGLAHWIRSSAKTYTFASDNGRLLSHTVPFGELDELSRDAVVVPLIRPSEREVVGMMNVQTLQEGRYDDEVVRAAEWLARALMVAVARDESEQTALDLYALYPELDSSQHGLADLLPEVAVRLGALHQAITALRSDHGDQRVDGLIRLSERTQAEIAELLSTASVQTRNNEPATTLALTPREAQIADLIVTDALTNGAIAERLGISTKTVKTHVGSILRKLGVTHRSEIAWVMRDGVLGPD